MVNKHETWISSVDAERLWAMLGERAYRDGVSAADAEQLVRLVAAARVVPFDELPAGTVGIDALIALEALGGSELRSVLLTEPADAEPALGRVSVLSSLGRALLGRAVGDEIEFELASGTRRRLRIVAVSAGARESDACARREAIT